MTQCPSRNDAQAATDAGECPVTWFGHMVQNCLDYAARAKEEGRPLALTTKEYDVVGAGGGTAFYLVYGTWGLRFPGHENP